VLRDAVPDDRRAFTVRLTPAGQRAFKRMAERHEGWIRELMGGLNEHERATLISCCRQ
jgi:DNA-binding MarR family transcriptional regulator